jgi:hypothetical protein
MDLEFKEVCVFHVILKIVSNAPPQSPYVLLVLKGSLLTPEIALIQIHAQVIKITHVPNSIVSPAQLQFPHAKFALHLMGLPVAVANYARFLIALPAALIYINARPAQLHMGSSTICSTIPALRANPHFVQTARWIIQYV